MATKTATKTAAAATSTVREVLVNPFKVGETIIVPAGTSFTSTAPTLKGRQKAKRAHKITVSEAVPAQLAPRKSETGSKVLVRPLRVRAKGSGGYVKDFNVTEKLIKLNGKTPTYEKISL